MMGKMIMAMSIAFALIHLQGCSLIIDLFRSAPEIEHGSAIGESPDVPSVDDRFPYGDPGRSRAGEWTQYRILDKSGERFVRISVTARDATLATVEVVETAAGKRETRIQEVAADRRILRSWYLPPENGRPPAPQTIRQQAQRGNTDWPKREEVGRKEIAGEAAALWSKGVAIETLVTHQDGRVEVVNSVWSADIPPLFDASPEGGLAKRTVDGLAIELVARGADARPSVQIPPRK